jgi:hypothetical protein
MRTHRFGTKLKLPATIAIKHQIKRLMLEDLIKQAEAMPRAEEAHRSLGEEIRSAERLV